MSGLHRRSVKAGITCRILDTSRIHSRVWFAIQLASFAARGWTLHLHTNGHNPNSWLLALLGGMAGTWKRGSTLTLHSGMMPGYLRSCPVWRMKLAGFTCRLYSTVICVGPELRDAALQLGMPAEHTRVAPAFVNEGSADSSIDQQLCEWISQHRPLLSSALFFRPEYGFELLLNAVRRLRSEHPALGCLVMGSGEQFNQAAHLVREAGLENDVLLLGDVSHGTCLALIARSDVFVRPTFEDGDSISVREALALGVPVVASRVGSRPPGTILFDPGDLEDLITRIAVAWETCVPA